MYKDKSIRLSNIISKYNIDVKPSGLLSILPPIKTDEVCAICGAYLYQKLKPRTGYASDSQKVNFAWSVDIGYMQKAYGKQKMYM